MGGPGLLHAENWSIINVDGQRIAFRRHGKPTSRGLVQSQMLVVPLRAITQSGSLNWVVGASKPHPKEALQLPEAVVSITETDDHVGAGSQSTWSNVSNHRACPNFCCG